MNGMRKLSQADLAWLKHHKIPVANVDMQKAIKFAGMIYGANKGITITAYIDKSKTFPCVLELWFEDSGGGQMYEIYLGDAWIDVMRSIDTRDYGFPLPKYDDIPF